MPPPEATQSRERIGMFQFICNVPEDPGEKAAHEGNDQLLRDFLLSTTAVGILALAYMGISTGLITFNKYFMHEGRFPYVIFLGMLHMSFSLLCNLMLYRVCPSLYPSLTDAKKQVIIDHTLVFRVLLPIAGCFGAQLVLSNMAFMHSSLAFLQMMKQSNVVLVYLFSLALALEHFSWKRTLVLVWIVGATGLTIHGELNFSLSGFAMQGFSMLCESLKLTLQSYSLSSAGRRLDALTFVLLVAPLVLLLLLALLLALHVLWPARPGALALPPWPALAEHWRLLLASGCLAFAMNVAHALLVKWSSATAFILIGVVMKDVVIVVVGALVLGELLSPLQVAGFTMQLVAILVWSLMKAAPALALDAGAAKAAGGWQELRPEDGRAPSPGAGGAAARGAGREAAATLLPHFHRPHSPSSRSNKGTGRPLNEEDSCPSDAVSHCGEGL
mmetsp:Transcript_6040/g.14195  ORF Transcript_6040/g.14195 Transcript_6040/m.14195 type:complete len:445 (+) Transcript_6040:43-1377(+)